jgi:hypothetical protein
MGFYIWQSADTHRWFALILAIPGDSSWGILSQMLDVALRMLLNSRIVNELIHIHIV